jgi:hypothetical protein
MNKKEFIDVLRTQAKYYNLSYPHTAKMFREAACQLEDIYNILSFLGEMKLPTEDERIATLNIKVKTFREIQKWIKE